jgi:molybdopterin-guanine dinucleotide biosynthesis protein A
MGGMDKAFLVLAGKPLISHVLDRLRPQVEAVILSANGDPSRFSGLGCEVVPDRIGQGPLAGILAALKAAEAAGATHVVTTPVDTPFLPADFVGRLQGAALAAPEGLALARTVDGDHPASALWPVTLVPSLAAYLAEGGAKVTRFADAHRAARADFPEHRGFLNLNTPEDLAAAAALLEGKP